MSPSQSAPYGAASSPIGGAKGCVGSGTLNNNLSFCWGKPAGTKHFLSRRQKTVEFLKNICYNTLNQTCRISSLVEWSLPKPQRRVRFPYPAPPQNDLLRQVVFLLLQGQHRAMGAADFGGSFVPIVQYKNGKYIQYSRIFHTFAWSKISRRISLPHYAVLPKNYRCISVVDCAIMTLYFHSPAMLSGKEHSQHG